MNGRTFLRGLVAVSLGGTVLGAVVGDDALLAFGGPGLGLGLIHDTGGTQRRHRQLQRVHEAVYALRVGSKNEYSDECVSSHR